MGEWIEVGDGCELQVSWPEGEGHDVMCQHERWWLVDRDVDGYYVIGEVINDEASTN